MIELVRITPKDAPSEESAWIVHRPETFDDAAKILRERFVHAVIIDDALASNFVKQLYEYYQYPFPRHRLCSIRPQGRAWHQPPPVGALLEPPWQTSLQAYLDAHPTIAASGWHDFEVGDPPRLDEEWLSTAVFFETEKVRESAWHCSARRAHAGRPTGSAIDSIIRAMAPDRHVPAYARSFVRHGDNAAKLRPFAEWVARCPLGGIAQMANVLLDDLDVHDGLVIAPPKDVPPVQLTVAGVEWESRDQPRVSPTTGSRDPTLTEPPPGLPCRACGSFDVGQCSAGPIQDFRDGSWEEVGYVVELRCRACRAYSRYVRDS